MTISTTCSSLLRRGGFAVGLLLSLFALTACGPRETQTQVAGRAGIMLVGNGAEPQDLDPQIITGIPERNITATLFEGLTKSNYETLEAEPGVATHWDVSEDGLRYVFYLRPEAVWSDGVPVTAHDFYESYKRILAAGLASDNADQMYPVVNAEAYHKGEITDFSQVGVKVLDDHTLEIRLRHPASYLLKTMASRSWYPVPLHVIKQFGDPYTLGNRWTRPGNLVGNGPFVLTKWNPNVEIEVAKSPTYWNRNNVKLNGIRFLPIENFPAEEAAFRAGQLHKTERVPLAKIAVYQQENPEFLHIVPYSGVYFFNFNVNKVPFTDVRVRQALAMAVDRESIVKNVTRAGEIPAYHFTPEGIGGYVSQARTKLDFDEARRLLAEAGYPGGKGMAPITLLYNTAENHRAIAETLQQVWRMELGIEVRLENQEWKVYLDSMDNRNFQLCRAGLIMEPYDPSEFLRVYTGDSGFNRTNWSNPEYDRLYKVLVNTVDEPTRQDIMQRMEKILTDEMPILPIYYYTNQYLMDPSVQGWKDNLLSLGNFDQITISTDAP